MVLAMSVELPDVIYGGFLLPKLPQSMIAYRWFNHIWSIFGVNKNHDFHLEVSSGIEMDQWWIRYCWPGAIRGCLQGGFLFSRQRIRWGWAEAWAIFGKIMEKFGKDLGKISWITARQLENWLVSLGGFSCPSLTAWCQPSIFSHGNPPCFDECFFVASIPRLLLVAFVPFNVRMLIWHMEFAHQW